MTQSGAAVLPLAIVGFFVTGVLAFLLTPLAARLATAAGAIDQPDAARRVHQAPVPRGGGVAVVAAFLLGAAGIVAYASAAHVVPRPYFLSFAEMASLLGGATLAAVLGFIDDRFDVRARWQFVAQIALALLAVVAGIQIGFINDPLGFAGAPFGGVLYFAGPIAAIVTVLWVVGMINSINFVDGLDGLSSGVGVIAALTLGAFSLTIDQNQPVVALLCFVLAGALAGFLPWNFHPARIFVGTTGVFVLGYALAVLSILGTAKIAVALLVLGVPIIDTFWIIVRRLAQGKSPFTADRGHFHHRLLDLGLSHREAVLVIYLICALLAVLSFVLSGTNKVYAFLGIVVGGGLVLYLLTRRSQEALEATSYDDGDPPADGEPARPPFAAAVREQARAAAVRAPTAAAVLAPGQPVDPRAAVLMPDRPADPHAADLLRAAQPADPRAADLRAPDPRAASPRSAEPGPAAARRAEPRVGGPRIEGPGPSEGAAVDPPA